MNDALRLVLLLIIAALALTAVGALIARSLDPARRLTRYLHMALGAEPEGVMMDRGGGRAMAFNLDAGKIAVLWDKGRKGLVYSLSQLVGAEMMVDNLVLNALRHGRSPVTVRGWAEGDDVVVTVSDDGSGIPPGTPPGTGIVGMRERAALLGGRLAIRGRRPGTEVRVEAPLL